MVFEEVWTRFKTDVLESQEIDSMFVVLVAKENFLIMINLNCPSWKLLTYISYKVIKKLNSDTNYYYS